MGMTPWKGKEATHLILRGVDARVKAAAEWFRDRLREAVSRPNPTRKDPSAPGEYPKRVTGEFLHSIKYRFNKTKHQASIGSSTDKARWLETGTSNMEARPWLSNGIRDFMNGIKEILQKKPADE